MPITVASININSLISHAKRHSLLDFLHLKNPDIILICETKLNPRHNVSFPGYNLIRNDRSTNAGGGTAILVRNSFKFSILNLGSSFESTCILIKFRDKIVAFAAIYRPPNSSLSGSTIDSLTESIFGVTDLMIIGGDFNAHHTHWGSSNCSSAGNILHSWLSYSPLAANLSVKTSINPTRSVGGVNSWLDLFLVSSSLLPAAPNPWEINSLNNFDCGSDHRAIVIRLRVDGPAESLPPDRPFDFNKANWSNLNSHIEGTIQDQLHWVRPGLILNHDSLDQIVADFTASITEAIETHIPRRDPFNSFIRLPIHVIALIKKKKVARRAKHRGHSTFEGLPINSFLSNINSMINNGINAAYKSHYKKIFNNLNPGSDVFKKCGLKRKSKQAERAAFIADTSDTQAKTPEDKAEMLARHFAEVSSSNSNNISSFESTVNDSLTEVFGASLRDVSDASAVDNNSVHDLFEDAIDPNLLINDWGDDDWVDYDSLRSDINSLCNNKSAGCDNISNRIIKNFSPNIIEFLVVLFNLLIASSYFPCIWKLALVIPILKRGKSPLSVLGFRPISLLSCLAKLFEIRINRILSRYADLYSIIPDSQFGFRPGYSTLHPLCFLANKVSQNLNNRTLSVAVSIDLKSAFDRVWHNGLIYKLCFQYNFPKSLCLLLHHFLSNRRLSVKIGSNTSSTRALSLGTPQGSVLSPLLFSLYLADFPSPPSSSIPIQVLQYADDTLLLASGNNLNALETNVNNFLGTLAKYFDKWKMSINVSKSEAICFVGKYTSLPRRVRRGHKSLKFVINTESIPMVKEIRYLGVYFGSSWSFVGHVNRALSKGCAAFQNAMATFNNKHIKDRVKVYLYKALVRPAFTYAFPVWSSISSHQMERLRAFERKMLRICLGKFRKPNGHYYSNQQIYGWARIERVDVHLLKVAFRFFDKASFSNLEIVKEFFRGGSQLTGFRHPIFIINHPANFNLYDDSGRLILYHYRCSDFRSGEFNANNPVYCRNQ